MLWEAGLAQPAGSVPWGLELLHFAPCPALAACASAPLHEQGGDELTDMWKSWGNVSGILLLLLSWLGGLFFALSKIK